MMALNWNSLTILNFKYKRQTSLLLQVVEGGSFIMLLVCQTKQKMFPEEKSFEKECGADLEYYALLSDNINPNPLRPNFWESR